jgi:hypothetical protein
MPVAAGFLRPVLSTFYEAVLWCLSLPLYSPSVPTLFLRTTFSLLLIVVVGSYCVHLVSTCCPASVSCIVFILFLTTVSHLYCRRTTSIADSGGGEWSLHHGVELSSPCVTNLDREGFEPCRTVGVEDCIGGCGRSLRVGIAQPGGCCVKHAHVSQTLLASLYVYRLDSLLVLHFPTHVLHRYMQRSKKTYS